MSKGLTSFNTDADTGGGIGFKKPFVVVFWEWTVIRGHLYEPSETLRETLIVLVAYVPDSWWTMA